MEFDERDEQIQNFLVLLEDVFREAKQLFLIGVALVLVFAAALGLSAKSSYRPVYQASASFTVRVVDPVYASVSSYNTKTAEQMARTFPYILTTGLLEDRVKAELEIAYLPSISVSVMPNSSIITLSVRDTQAQRAYDVLNAVIRHYPQIAEFVVGPTALVLLDESGLPTAPVNSLSLKGSVVKGGILGGGLWFAVVLIMALSKTTIHNEGMLRKRLNIDCFGRIPSVKLPQGEKCPLLNKGRRKTEFAEAVRSVRLRVERALEAENRKVLLVSSAIPGEGKTTLSVNLGIAMAQRGKRVLIIDCDLRNPSVAKSLKMNCEHSLADYLQGKLTVKDVVCPTETENLFIIPSVADENIDTDQLTSNRGTGMLQAARRLYDLVILDTPPCSMLSDAGEVAGLADAGLLVVRQDYASRDQILDGVQRLGDADLPMIGWVLNHAKHSLSSRDYYGYGYGYSGGYGYGYGKKENME
jgi:receptor protein-tyrosine kinase